MGLRTLYVVRHGATPEGDAHGRRGPGLSERGREQARLVARALAEEPITAVWSSTLLRAVETAAPISEALPAAPWRRSRVLCECVPALPLRYVLDQEPPEKWQLIRERFAIDITYREEVTSTFRASLSISPAVISTGLRQAEAASRQFFAPVRGRDRHEVVVTHGNLLRYFVCRALGAPPESFGGMVPYHCGISRFTVDERGQVLLVSFNDMGHLPPALRSEL